MGTFASRLSERAKAREVRGDGDDVAFTSSPRFDQTVLEDQVDLAPSVCAEMEELDRSFVPACLTVQLGYDEALEDLAEQHRLGDKPLGAGVAGWPGGRCR